MSLPHHNETGRTTEIWRSIRLPFHTQDISFSKYQVSSDGRVRSKKRDGWRVLKNISIGNGRLIGVSLCRDHDQRLDDQGVARVHRLTVPVLVLYSFTDNPPPVYLPLKYHDDNKCNARLENLSFGYRGDLGSLYDLTWTRARHPLLYEANGAYFVSPTGIVSFVHSTTCIRSLPAVSYIQNTNQPFISTDTNISVLVEEIVAYTFDNFYQRDQHYIFHRDGDRLNCSWSNLRVCHTLDDQRSVYIDALRRENPERTFAPIQHMDATYSFSRYFVSDLGEVFTLNRNRQLAPYKNEHGYYRACLTADTTDDQGGYVKRMFAVQRLVWAAFKGAIPHDQFVDHKNGKRYDNRLVNLRLATRSENKMYSMTDEQTAQRMLEVSDGTRATVVVPVVDETTEWKPIGTLHGYAAGRFGPFSQYEVSENGCVRHRRNMDNERLSGLFLDGSYHSVSLYLTQEQKQRHPTNIERVAVKVHVLVAHAFVEEYGIEGRTMVDHKDGDRTNNHYSNLRWVTPQENSALARGKPVRVTAVHLNESKTINSIGQTNREGYLDSRITSVNFRKGPFEKMGVWNNKETLLRFELV